MRKLSILLLMLAVSAAAFAGGSSETAVTAPQLEGYASNTTAGVNVQWKIDGDKLDVQLASATTGWIAIGFDPERMMRGADMIIGYVKDGVVTIEDHYGVSNTSHASDASQGGTDDVTVLGGEEAGGGTLLRFSIPLDSGDAYDKVLTPGSTYRVIVAHGPNGSDNVTAYHAQRGAFDMDL